MPKPSPAPNAKDKPVIGAHRPSPAGAGKPAGSGSSK